MYIVYEFLKITVSSGFYGDELSEVESLLQKHSLAETEVSALHQLIEKVSATADQFQPAQENSELPYDLHLV